MSIAELIISIANKAKGIKDNVLAAYDVIERKGGVIPEEKNISNLQGAIEQLRGYTGHIDEEGLRAIGWRDEDIQWLKSRIDWDSDDDDIYKVPQQLIDLYVENGGWSGELVQLHQSRTYYKWCPYFNAPTPSATNGVRHTNAYYVIGFPILPFFDEYGTNLYNMFNNCYALKFIPPCGFINADINNTSVYIIEGKTIANMTLNTTLQLKRAVGMHGNVSIPNSVYLKDIKLKSAYGKCSFYAAANLPKEDILYIITNSSGNTATIELEPTLLADIENDNEIHMALNSFPNIQLITK